MLITVLEVVDRHVAKGTLAAGDGAAINRLAEKIGARYGWVLQLGRAVGGDWCDRSRRRRDRISKPPWMLDDVYDRDLTVAYRERETL